MSIYKNLASLPENLLPGLAEMPGELARIAAAIEEIAPGKGVRAALRIVDEYGATPIYIQNMESFRAKLRNREIIKLYDGGMTANEIARRLDVSESTVRKALADTVDDRQLKLF